MEVVQDNLWLCVDCLMGAVNGDLSGCYDDERAAEAKAALAEMPAGLVPDFDTETGEGHYEFAHLSCDCCKSQLAGEYHRFAVLG